MDRKYVCLFIFVVQLPTHVICTLQQNCMCKDMCTNNCTFMSLTCPVGQLIYDPSITGYSRSDCSNGTGSCVGLSPKLLVNKNECNWKNHFHVKLTEEEPMINIDSNPHCYNSPVRSVLVQQWKCVDEKVITDICSVVNNIIPSDHVKGIIRSHPGVPWNYDESLFSTKQNCSISLHPKISDSDEHHEVAISVDFLDFDKDTESLTINNNAVLEEGFQMRENGGHGGITIKFSTKADRQSNGGKGFVICYKFLARGDIIGRDTSVCDELLTTRKNPECIECHYEEPRCTSKCDYDLGAVTVMTSSNLTLDSHESCPTSKEEEKECPCFYGKPKVTKCGPGDSVFNKTFTLEEKTKFARECCLEMKTVATQCHCVYKNETKYKKNRQMLMTIYTLKTGESRQVKNCKRKHIEKTKCEYGPCRKNRQQLVQGDGKCPKTIKCGRKCKKRCRVQKLKQKKGCEYDTCCRNNHHKLKKGDQTCPPRIKCKCKRKRKEETSAIKRRKKQRDEKL